MNKKNTIRLTESQLKRVISESIKKVLKEDIKVVDKIPNFDRNTSYEKYNNEWMKTGDARTIRQKEAEDWRKRREERNAEWKRRQESIAPYRPLLDELFKLEKSCENAIWHEDTDGNDWLANSADALNKLAKACISMRYIGNKEIMLQGYQEAHEALEELGDVEINKPKIFKLLNQVKEIIEHL